MCGIGGQFNWRTGAPVARPILEQMAARMAHRGPDGEGFFAEASIGLAHRRLAIIDIAGGAQPMFSHDGRFVIVYNGEVYNYIELFRELSAKGHTPRTHSDTEAVLMAYQEWGLDFPKHLNGMFAIAIWDTALRRLVLCRDRLGVKPLYYADTPDGLVFASEIKALRKVPGVDLTLDLEALDEYMTLGYVVHPRCMERGIKKVAPASIVTIEAGRGVQSHSYWNLRFEPDFTRTADQWEGELRELFDDVIRLQRRSDVPVGVLLSGGVDSTAVAASLAAHDEGHGVDTFCVGVDIPGALTEFEAAKQTAMRLGTRHHEKRLSNEEHGRALLDAAESLDQPLAEPMIGQLLAVSRLAREHVVVLLSGEGSDETWFGYGAYRVMAALEWPRRVLPGAAMRQLEPVLRAVADHAGAYPKVSKFLRLAAEPLERRYLGLNHFDTSVKNQLYSSALREELSAYDSRESVRHFYNDTRGGELVSRMAYVDCCTWLVDNTLLRSDILSMAASVELRVPFLDHRLVELAGKVPSRYKISMTDQKIVLKDALRDHVPDDVRRRRKLGFPTPVAALFRSSWGESAGDVLRNPSARTADLFDRKRLLSLLAEHRRGTADWNRQLFQVLMLEHWARAAQNA